MTSREDGVDGVRAATPDAARASERWREVQRVVDGALNLPAAERSAYLDSSCGTDAALRDSAARLLDACERADDEGGPLAGPAVAFAAPMLADLALHDAMHAGARSRALGDALRAALAERYVVERELGHGGMATVFMAHDRRHDRTVAVKGLEPDVAPGGAERFLNEIRIAGRLTHPHVLSVFDSGEADGLLFYVMPYVAGETLRARLAREGSLPLGDAMRLIRELADALAYAHGHGVMHRDLKPENVLLSGGHAVVADFGIAKALAVATQDGARPLPGLTSTGMALGTPAYMAPEQAVGDPSTDHRADLYALGVVAYEVLAGAHPFGARTAQALVKAHLTEPPAPLAGRRADVPPELARLVMRLLAKDAAERPQSADDVLRALDATTLRPASPARMTVAPRRIVLAVSTVLLAATAIGGYALWRSASPLGERDDGGRGDASTIRTASAGAQRTLAVLPFVNTSGTSSDDYFSDGMTDELAHALARLPGLRIAGRTSSYSFKGKTPTAQEIGRVLDVGAYVGGTVRRAGERLRVTTQLVSTTDGKVLWDSVYESSSGDVFAVQDEFTRAMTAALGPALGIRSASATTESSDRGTTDTEAYDLYLKGRYHWLERGRANVVRSIALFRQATARDPSFARAHAGLAMAYGVLSVYVPDPGDSTSALTTASALRALALDSTLADAHSAMALALERQLRFREAESHYRTALAYEPSNVMAHHGLGMLLMGSGHTEESVAELRRATQLDPLAKSAATAATMTLIAARRFPEAAATARRALALDSTFPLALMAVGVVQTFSGQPDSAVQTLEAMVRASGNTRSQPIALVFAYAAAGRWDDVRRIRARLHRAGGDESGGAITAFTDLVFGDREPLIRLLSTDAGRRRWYDFSTGFGCNPYLDPLASDDRFRAAMRAVNVQVCPLAQPWPITRPDAS